MAHERRSDQRSYHRGCKHPRRAQHAHHRRPHKVVLLLDGQRPRRTERRRQRQMKQVLHAKNVSQPRRGLDCLPHAGADEPGRIQINHDQQQQIDGPDAQRPARMKVVKVARLVARGQQDGRDEEAREREKKNDAGPAPQRGVVDPRALQSRIAVIENHRENRQTAQPVKFGQILRKPGWALDRQSAQIMTSVGLLGEPLHNPSGQPNHSLAPSLPCSLLFYPAASCRARSVARITALISVTRSPPSSSSRMPSIVHPAGVVTASLSSAG